MISSAGEKRAPGQPLGPRSVLFEEDDEKSGANEIHPFRPRHDKLSAQQICAIQRVGTGGDVMRVALLLQLHVIYGTG